MRKGIWLIIIIPTLLNANQIYATPDDTLVFYTWGGELVGDRNLQTWANCREEVFLANKIKYKSVGGCIINSRKELWSWKMHNVGVSFHLIVRHGILWRRKLGREITSCGEESLEDLDQLLKGK